MLAQRAGSFYSVFEAVLKFMVIHVLYVSIYAHSVLLVHRTLLYCRQLTSRLQLKREESLAEWQRWDAFEESITFSADELEKPSAENLGMYTM